MTVHVGAAIIGAVVCGLAGLAMPWLVARLPEPAPDPEPAEGVELTASQQARLEEPPKELYADMAARAGFGSLLAFLSLVAGALLGGRVGVDWLLLLLLPLAPLGATLAVIDLRTRLLPSRLINPATLAALAYVVVASLLAGSAPDVVRGVLGLVIAYVFFAVLSFVYPRGMGFGDVRLAGLLGLVLAYLGWALFVVGLYLPFLIFGLPGVVLALVRWDAKLLKAAYPFGPFLLVGGLVGVLFGQQVVDGLVNR